MLAAKTATPTSSSRASGTATVACCGGVRSTDRTVWLTHDARQNNANARPEAPAARERAPNQRLFTGFVATVFLPQLLFEHRVGFVHCGFAQLARHNVVVARICDVARHARHFRILL